MNRTWLRGEKDYTANARKNIIQYKVYRKWVRDAWSRYKILVICLRIKCEVIEKKIGASDETYHKIFAKRCGVRRVGV